MRIYFIGAHATGKTTMSRYVSRKWGLPMITEVARSVLSELESSLEALRTDMDLVAEYQKRVFERQISVERMQDGAGSGFVSDRAFDNLAYAAEHTTILGDILATDGCQEYLRWVAEGTVFFVRPHRDLLKEDGVRASVTWESVLRIDGMIKWALEAHKIPYLPLESPLMQERVRAVEFVLRRLGGMPIAAPAPAAAVAPKVVSLVGPR
jgi:hypothetical protein